MVSPMTLEILLILVSIGMTIGLGVYVVKRPSIVVNASYTQLKAELKALKEEMEQERAEHLAEMSALKAELTQERKLAREDREQNRRLYNELQREIAIRALREYQLCENHLEPHELPEHLRESRLDIPSVAIRLTTQGGNVAVRGDIVGGDLRENAQKKEEE